VVEGALLEPMLEADLEEAEADLKEPNSSLLLIVYSQALK
jgi:hypothetical protein